MVKKYEVRKERVEKDIKKLLKELKKKKIIL
jgi:hypothetical protein